MKLDTDEAWKGIDIAGGGGVIRRDTGTWFIGLSSKYNAHTPPRCCLVVGLKSGGGGGVVAIQPAALFASLQMRLMSYSEKCWRSS